ncbi:MAG UNVERIFIED_CONTAM: hypothetical protein LOD86_00020 [Thermobifida fusca]
MKPRDIGTRAETAVVRYLRDHGWPHAERRALRGNHDAGDITGTPGVCWSVKAGQYARDPSDLLIRQWTDELLKQRQNAGADHAVLITRRWRVADPQRWWAWIDTRLIVEASGGARWDGDPMWLRGHLWQAVEILRRAGYGSEVQP